MPEFFTQNYNHGPSAALEFWSDHHFLRKINKIIENIQNFDRILLQIQTRLRETQRCHLASDLASSFIKQHGIWHAIDIPGICFGDLACHWHTRDLFWWSGMPLTYQGFILVIWHAIDILGICFGDLACHWHTRDLFWWSYMPLTYQGLILVIWHAIDIPGIYFGDLACHWHTRDLFWWSYMPLTYQGFILVIWHAIDIPGICFCHLPSILIFTGTINKPNA